MTDQDQRVGFLEELDDFLRSPLAGEVTIRKAREPNCFSIDISRLKAEGRGEARSLMHRINVAA